MPTWAMVLKKILNVSEPVASLDHYLLVLTLISWFILIHLSNYKIIWLVSRGSLLFKLAWCRLPSLEIIYTTSNTTNEPCDWTRSSPLNMTHWSPWFWRSDVINALSDIIAWYGSQKDGFATLSNCGIKVQFFYIVVCPSFTPLTSSFPVYYILFGLNEC